MAVANTLCKLPRGALLLSLSFQLCVREPQARRRAHKQPLFATVLPPAEAQLREPAQPRTEETIHGLRERWPPPRSPASYRDGLNPPKVMKSNFSPINSGKKQMQREKEDDDLKYLGA